MGSRDGNGGALGGRSWPLVERPARSVLAVLIIVAAAAAVYALARNVALTVLGALVLVASLHGHVLPRRYALDEEGVSVWVMGMKKTRAWGYFRSYYADRMGIMLSTFTYPSRLDPFRGLGLRFAGGNRDDVIAFIRGKLPPAQKRSRRSGRR